MVRSVPRWLLPGELAVLGAPPGRPESTVRDRVADAALFTGAALVWWHTVAAPPPYYADVIPGWMPAVDPHVGAAACAALWLRRRFPVAVALAVLAAMLVADSALGATHVMVLTVAVHRNWPVAAAVTVGYLLPTTTFIAGNPQPGLSRWFGVAVTALMYLVPLGWGLAVRARRQLVVSLRRDADRERQEHALRLAGARRAERARIAREMHDVLAHRVSLISVHAGALAYRTAQADAGTGRPLDAAEVGQAIGVIDDNARHALEDLRDVLNVLREGDVEGGRRPQPVIADIERLVGEARAAGQPVTYDAPGVADVAALPGSVQRTVYRTVQEGLTNVRKHAPGTGAVVRLAARPGTEVVVTVTNRLPSGAPAGIPGAGAGLAGLAERAALDGGTVEHGVRGGAFWLSARLPWPA